MIVRALADSVRLDMDETGWVLSVDTDEGDSFILNIQACAHEFIQSRGIDELLRWRIESKVPKP